MAMASPADRRYRHPFNAPVLAMALAAWLLLAALALWLIL